MVGDHGNRAVDENDLPYSLDGARGRFVRGFRLAAKHRRDGNRCNSHSRQPGIDAVRGATSHLVRCVEPLHRSAYQGKILGLLQRHAVRCRHRQAGGFIDQVAIAQATRAAGVVDYAIPGMAGRGIDAPALRRGRNQQDTADRAGLAQLRPASTDRRRKPRCLNAKESVGVELTGGCMLQPDLVEADLQLLRQQHRQRGVRSLPHLDHWHHKCHHALAVDADEGVWREGRRRLVSSPARAQQRRQCDGERKAAANGGTGLEETASIKVRRQIVRHGRALPQAAAWWIAARMR